MAERATEQSTGPSEANGGRDLPKVPRFSKDHMDATADPSVDFYRYACGRWVSESSIPEDKWGWNSFYELTDRNHALLHGLLEDLRGGPEPPMGSVPRLVRDFYASALDTERREALKLAPIRDELGRLDRIGTPEELVRTLALYHRRGLGGLFETAVYPDDLASRRYALRLGQGGLSLPDRDYYRTPQFAPQLKGFQEHLARAFGSLGESPSEASASAKSVFALEVDLAMASRSRTELQDVEKNYHRLEAAELTTRWPHLAWPAYLGESGLARSSYAIVGQPEFLDAVDRLVAERPIEAWRSYLRWNLLHGSAPFLHEEVERAEFEFFQQTLLGQREPEPRWLRALRVIDATVGEALGELYVERWFPADARARMVALVDDLRKVFQDRLAHLEWMTPATRARALEKFGRFEAKVGHPDRFRDYRSVRIDPLDYLGNVRRATEFEFDRQAVRVEGPVDRTEWGMTPPQVNAYFNRTQNEIVFPAGILQPPFFDATMDDAVNFGGIGAVIAHEITHGYDDQGRKYDRDGNLADWWTSEDAKAFEAKAAHLVAQYSAFEGMPGVPVNGALTLGENIADLGGVSIAFEALERRLASDPSARRTIDGLTPEQRFFLSWAQIWKENVRDDARRLRLTIDPHAPGRPRAIGPVVHLDEFVRAFGIREGSAMWRPPERRVTIW